MKRQLERAPIQIERDNLKAEVESLKNALAQKDNEINSLKSTVSSSSSNNYQKDSEINSLKSTISNNVSLLSQKDNEIAQLKKEMAPLKEKLTEYKHLADEKAGMVDLLKSSLEELKIDKIDLRKDKLALLAENEQLKKQLLDFSILGEEPHQNVHGTITDIMGQSIHTTESQPLNNEVSLAGSHAVSNFNFSEEI